MSALSIFAPAKLNLFLAITGRRDDGFHELLSVVAPLNFGDTLEVEPAAAFTLACDDLELPVDESNLVLKAARAFAVAAKWSGGARFLLHKRVPTGAGLGGGSSDAVAALRALNTLAGMPLNPVALAEIAAQVGSDCPLFLHAGPVAMRGRGERVEPLPPAAAGRLQGRRVLVFKPGFGIATAWAYERLAAAATAARSPDVAYIPAAEAEARLATWLLDPSAAAESLLFNNMERPAFAKYFALPTLLAELHAQFGLTARMSGSGSACFALLSDDQSFAPLAVAIRAAWGNAAFVIEARLA